MERVDLSETRMGMNYPKWQELEEKFMLHRTKSKRDKENDAKGKDNYQSIDVSFSYTLMMTAHAYYVNTFLARPVVFPIDSVNGEGAIKEQIVESLLQYQVRKGNILPALMVWFLDVSRYGVGIVCDYWTEEFKTKTTIIEEPEMVDGVPTGKQRTGTQTERIPGYKGNKVFNVLPYDFLPDPRVPMMKVQEGEFVGRRVTVSWNEFLRRYATGEYINKEQAYKLQGRGAKKNNRSTAMSENTVSDITYETDSPKGIKNSELYCVEMVIEIIPKDWGMINGSDYPEKWVFTVANRELIIGARPLGRRDDIFPFHVLEQEIDGYFHNSRGLLEINQDMNDTLSWLLNSHMYNKEQAIYNQFVYDPSKVVQKDLLRREPGKMVRLKPTAYGTDVRAAISQLPVNDVTMQNYQDTQVIERMMQRTVGINDDVAGTSQGSSRRSATEFRGTTQFSADRLADSVIYFSVTGFQSLARSLVSTSLDNYTDEMTVKIAGDNIPTKLDLQTGQFTLENGAVTFTPEDIAGEYDLVPTDGTAPIDRGMQSQMYLQYMQQALAIPGFAEEYRLPSLMRFIMKNAGLTGIDRFKIRTLSDDELLAIIKEDKLNGNRQANPQAGGTQGGGGGNAGVAQLPAPQGPGPVL